MSNSRFDFNLALVKGRLFAIGGTATANKDRPNESFDSVECYEPITNQWTFVASMIKRRSQAACAVANGRLYVFGGYDNDLGVNAATDTVEYYDPERNTWTLVRFKFVLFLIIFFKLLLFTNQSCLGFDLWFLFLIVFFSCKLVNSILFVSF